jgi:hypothetical protein
MNLVTVDVGKLIGLARKIRVSSRRLLRGFWFRAVPIKALGLFLMLQFSTGLFTIGYCQMYTTHFEGEENPPSEEGKWQNAGLDWARVKKSHGIAFGTQTGTNTGSAQYNDSYAHQLTMRSTKGIACKHHHEQLGASSWRP